MASARSYMLDTNTASYIIRGNNRAILDRLQQHSVADVCISAITEAELRFGLARKPGATALQESVESFLRHVESLPWNSEVAVCYGTLRAEMEAAGRPIGNMDMLIAAHALAVDCVLVSHDATLMRVPGLDVEDWMRG